MCCIHGHCYSDLQNCENNLKPFYGTSLLSLLNNFKVPTRCMKLETNSFLSRFLTICTHLLDDWHGNVEGDRDVVWLRYGVYHAIHHAQYFLSFISKSRSLSHTNLITNKRDNRMCRRPRIDCRPADANAVYFHPCPHAHAKCLHSLAIIIRKRSKFILGFQNLSHII